MQQSVQGVGFRAWQEAGGSVPKRVVTSFRPVHVLEQQKCSNHPAP